MTNKGVFGAIVIVAVAPALVGVAWILGPRLSSPLEADQPVQPLSARLESVMRDDARIVGVEKVFRTGRTLTVAANGVITGVSIRPKKSVQLGDEILRVDGKGVVAVGGGSPPFRDVAAGMSGPDVRAVQQMLSARGLPSGSTKGKVTSATLQGFRELNRRLGRQDEGSTLSRGTLVWIGADPLKIGSVSARLGDEIAGRSVLAVARSRVDSIKVKEPEGSSSGQASGKYVLAVGDKAVPYELGSGRVRGSKAVAIIASAMKGNTGVATVKLQGAERVAGVPASALVTGANGEVCLFADVSGPGRAVEPVGGDLSTSYLPNEWVGRTVLANPRDVREDLACG